MARLLQTTSRPSSRRRGAAAPVLAFAGAVFLGAATTCHAEANPGPGGAPPDVYARDEGLSVQGRPHPEYDPLGVRVGPFLVFPRLISTAAVDDNILATPNGAIADAVVTFAPAFAARSDWNQNAVSLDVGLIARQFVAHPAQDSVQYAVTGAGLLDVRHDLTVRAAVSHDLTLLPRIADGYARVSLTPLLYDETAAHVETTKVFDRLRLDGVLTFEDYRYHDGRGFGGERLDEGFRDRTSVGGGLRADYALSGAVGLFIEETLTHVDRRASLGGRDATQTLFGPNFELGRLIVGEVGVGYLTSDSTATGARSVGHFAVRGRLEYFPTPLVTITLTGGQSVIDSGLPNSPAYLSTVVAIGADYELLRNLILSAKAGGTWDRYQVIDRQDHSLSFSVGAVYQANRGLGLGLTFQRVRRTSSGVAAGLGLEDDVVSLAVTLRR